VVGKGFRGLTDAIVAHGYGYIVLKDRLEPNTSENKSERQVACDFSSQALVLRTVAGIQENIVGVMALYDNYILPASWISEQLQLPGLPLDAALACTDKELMRERLATAPGRISPDFTVVQGEGDLRAFTSGHPFPLILKPAHLSKSLLVTVSHSLEELLANYHDTLAHITQVYKKYMPNHAPKLLVESFLQGSIHSVDAFVDHRGEPHVLDSIVDYQSAREAGFADSFLYSRTLPSRLSKKDQQALRRSAELGIRALGMRSCPAHAEVIMTKDGPFVVEIAARQGGYRERMHRLANDLDIPGQALRVALGQQPDLSFTKNEPCAVLELFPRHAGAFKGLVHEKKLRALPSLYELSIKAELGQRVGKAADGYKMCAVVVLHHTDLRQLEKDLRFVRESVSVIVE
jgi:hypothetical protein